MRNKDKYWKGKILYWFYERLGTSQHPDTEKQCYAKFSYPIFKVTKFKHSEPEGIIYMNSYSDNGLETSINSNFLFVAWTSLKSTRKTQRSYKTEVTSRVKW